MKRITAFTLTLLVMITTLLSVLPVGIFALDAEVIVETTEGYSGSLGYGGKIVRTKSDGSIMMSPFINQLKEAIDGGANLNNYTVELTFSLLEGNGGKVRHTFDKVSASLTQGNGTYFDIYLNGSKGNTGFCPIAGEYYNVDISIYTGYGTDKQEKVLYGTYKNAEIPTDIKTSKFYKPSAVPGNAGDYKVTVSYSFNNELKGSAAGMITVSVDKPGNYEIGWGNEQGKALTVTTGEKTLEYSALASFAITSSKGGEHVEKVIGFTAIPAGAKTLIITDGAGVVLKSLELPEDKLLDEKSPEYTFGIVSDVHFNYFFDSTKTIDYAEGAFDTALSFYKSAGVKLVSAVGDYSLYGEEESYKEFYNAVKKSGMFVIACGGNHELYAKLDVMFGKNGYWRKYMNTGIYDGSVEGVLNIAKNGIDFVYQIPGVSDSVFISLSQWYWDGHTPAQGKLVEPEQLEWLAEQLEIYKDKTVYFMFHTYLSDDDYENRDGQGDLTSKGGYSYGGNYNEYTDDEKVFRSLLTKYDNVIWFNGHSHYEYSMQMHNENVNIFDYQGTTATMVHVPSVTNPRTVAVNGTSYSSLAGSASQGGLQFVYDGYQIMNGIDLINEKILSYACYIIYTDKEGIVESGELADGKITWTYDAQLNSLRILGNGAIEGFGYDNAPWIEYSKDIKYVYIGSGITSICDQAFASLVNLEAVEIKEGVTTIGKKAFENTAINSLILPASVINIDEGAFGGIEKIASIVYGGTAEKWNAITIGNNNNCLEDKISFKSVKITFVCEDVTWVVDVSVGEIPSFDVIPVKNHPDDNKHYRFTGWSLGSKTYPPSADLPKATANATYTAVFGEEIDRYVSGSISGSKIEWTLDRKTATLTVEGKGLMPDFADPSKQPWVKYASEIQTVIVKKGIISVGKNAFSKLPYLSKAIIEHGITKIQMDSFAYNEALTELTIPTTLKSIGQGAVYNTPNIKTIFYGGTEEQWQKLCDSVTTMYNETITLAKNLVYEGKDRNCIHVALDMVGYDGTNHWSRCKICNENFDTTAHQLDDWTIVKQPTFTEEGVEKGSCKCGYSETRAVAVLEETEPTTLPAPTQDVESNPEGSILPVIIVVVVLVVAAVAVIVVLVVLKKKTNKTK